MVVAQRKADWQQPLPEMQPSKPAKYRKIAPRRKSWQGILVLLLISCLVGGTGAARIYLSTVKSQQISVLQKDIEALAIQNDALRVEVNQLSSVGRIESMALGMGMEKPTDMVYVVGSLSVLNSKTGIQSALPAPIEDTVATETAGAPSTIKQISQFFTGYFASTQH
ncbi:MAG: septum formation initiator family protein [Peptococcaceae bacterium]|nr:septum formation initiator family protein [Peptococcaceae bacterium]